MPHLLEVEYSQIILKKTKIRCVENWMMVFFLTGAEDRRLCQQLLFAIWLASVILPLSKSGFYQWEETHSDLVLSELSVWNLRQDVCWDDRAVFMLFL